MSALPLWALIFVFVYVLGKIEQAACPTAIKVVNRPTLLPEWALAAAFAACAVCCLWSSWRCYKDHVMGEYDLDIERWRDGEQV